MLSREQPIANGLNDAAAMLDNPETDQFTVQHLQAFEHTPLIGLHLPAVINGVGRELVPASRVRSGAWTEISAGAAEGPQFVDPASVPTPPAVFSLETFRTPASVHPLCRWLAGIRKLLTTAVNLRLARERQLWVPSGASPALVGTGKMRQKAVAPPPRLTAALVKRLQTEPELCLRDLSLAYRQGKPLSFSCRPARRKARSFFGHPANRFCPAAAEDRLRVNGGADLT